MVGGLATAKFPPPAFLSLSSLPCLSSFSLFLLFSLQHASAGARSAAPGVLIPHDEDHKAREAFSQGLSSLSYRISPLTPHLGYA